MNTIKNIKTVLVAILSLLLLGGGAYALTKDYILVFDSTSEEHSIPKKFRSSTGLDVSASGQFSAQELQQLLHAIPAPAAKIWIVDLRQESHGFINGMPITWSTDENSINKNKPSTQIARHEKTLLANLRQKSDVTIFELKKLPHGKMSAGEPSNIIVQEIESEEQLVIKNGANYQRFYVLDHHKPDDHIVDEYVAFIKSSLKPGEWMHFHCRGGKGRSSTFIAMYDMILNAQQISFDDIMLRQQAMGNIKLDEIPTNADKLWKIGALKDRMEFLNKFYAYVLDPKGYQKHSWSEWLAVNADSYSH